MEESQPWHYLSDPLGFIEDIKIPKSIDMGFKINRLNDENKEGINFKLKIEDQAFESQINGEEIGSSLGGKLKFDQIELLDF